jgi:type IV fimbrial biogenesis protein FimT
MSVDRCEQSHARPLQAQTGLSLIELMITLTILAILLTVGIPSFQSTAAKNRLATSASQFQGALALARTEAIRRGTRVTVCVRSGNACINNAAREWANGWIVFEDGSDAAAGEAAGTIDANDDVIRRYDALPDDLVLAGNGGVTWYVSYVSSGQTRTTGGGMQIGTIRACTKSAAVGNDYRSKDLAINASGRVAVSVTAGVTSDCPDP